LAEFVINNKVYLAMKVSPFMVNYGRELRMGRDIRKKGKIEKAMEFVEKMKKSIRGGRSSLKENTGGYDETSR